MQRPAKRPPRLRRLAAAFRLDGGGLRLWGLCCLAFLSCCLALGSAVQAAWAGEGLTLVHQGGDPPYCFRDGAGQPAGLLVDYWRLWGREAGVEVRIVLAEGEDVLSLVAAGHADAHAGLPLSPELEGDFLFSRPLLDLGIGIFVAGGKGGMPPEQLEGASGTVGLVLNDHSAAFLAATFPNLRQQYFLDMPALATAAVLGQVGIVAGPVLALRHHLALQQDQAFTLARVFPGVQLRAAVSRGNAQLLERLNAGIAAVSPGDVRALERTWGKAPWRKPGWAYVLSGCAALLAAGAWAFLRVRRLRAGAEARIRAADLMAGNLMAEMTRLRKTQDLFMAAIEQSPSGIVLAYADGSGPPVFNRQALRILGLNGSPPAGFRPEDHVWRAFLPSGALVAPEDMPLARALARGESFENMELRLELADGAERWISASAAPVRDANGELRAAVLVFSDSTGARQTARDLARFKFFLESGVEEVYLVRPDGTLAYVNEAVARSLGHPRSDLLGQPVSFIDPGYTPEILQGLLRLVRAGQHTFETTQLTRTGVRVLKEMKAFYMRFGEEEYLCAFGQDITERKRMQKELESTRTLFSAAMDQSLSGVVIADAAGRITIANQAAAAMLDTTQDVLKGMSMGRFLPSWRFLREDGTPVSPDEGPILRAVAQGQSTRDLVALFSRPGEADRWLLANAAPIRSEAGAVIAAILTLTDITARKEMEAQLLFKAHHDALTGLANRTLCLERIQQVLEDSQRRNTLFAVAFMDLDRFKMLNDSLGHSFGDLVLVEAARRLVRGLRGLGQVCRFGGDEFVLIVEEPGTPEEAQAAIRSALDSLCVPFTVEGQEVRLTASVGVVVGPTADSPRAEDILQNADMAMHRAKDGGRDRIRLFHPGMQRRARELLTLDADMRKALEQDEFTVYYQPVMSITGDRTLGLEALVRWKSPTRGLVTPHAFIPHAEESGLIVPLGELVLRRACATMAAWRERFPQCRGMTLAVNLSARQFTHPDIVETVRQILRESGLPPAHLKLELTESTLMGNPEAALSSMRRLKATGVSLAIDDFGTGYSSLAYLQRFPVDILKIDRSFVHDLPREHSDSRELVRAIMALARSLRLSVVAEGVETREQLDLLGELGCEAVQGFYFSPALPEAGVEAFFGVPAACASGGFETDRQG
ncbi:MAG: EAL domain-containing protein [Proteobacteria bacterium]|nr:EAL domain-containing protein [Pseudomonadota bacterium]MBU1595912.1 EAL domain-containing protein [Pseudomonadota bacterium]